MTRKIMKQPNGLWAIFSTVADDFIYINLPNLKGYIQERRQEAADDAERGIRIAQGREEKFGTLREGFDDCMETIKAVHGAKKAAKLRKQMSKEVAD